MTWEHAAEIAFDSLAEGRPITVGLIEDLHAQLVAGTAADTSDAGRIRSIQVAIGTQGGGVDQARFIPMPPGTTLKAAFGDLVEWIRRSENDVTDRDSLVAAAMTHYQFETIHPFNDGNGRLSRLLIVLQLLQDHVLTEPLLSVSPWFEARRSQYQDALAEVSMAGDWNAWVTFFAHGLEASAIDTARRLESLLVVQQHYHDVLRDGKARGIVRDIVAGGR
ncbi:MAG: cell filamentation protein Fic [Subtercola sp.]|nr:cell filamentation protein Fic [Subtercola sp.]